MNYTSIEQSKKLLELGLNSDTADLLYECFKDEVYGDVTYSVDFVCNWQSSYPDQSVFEDVNTFIPCWSLGALMNLLPPSIQTGEGMQNQYEIDIRKYWGNEENLYQIAYGNDRGLSEEWHDMINTGEKESLCDAVFEMVCWLLKNGYIKKEE